MKRFIFVLLTLCVLFSIVIPSPVRALDANPTLKIGLFYNLNALPAANLQNVTGYGAGYRFGWFDGATRVFSEVFSTSETTLTILKDKPIYVGSGNVYYDTMPASSRYSIGPYHLETAESYASAGDAASAAERVKSYGFQAFPAYINGVYKVRIGQYMTQQDAEAARASVGSTLGVGVSVCGASKSCYTVTVTGTDRILFEFDSGGSGLGIMPVGNGSTPAQTWFKGYKYYGGFEYLRLSGNDLTVLNVVSMDQYLRGVIPYEMSPSWPIEALKAQALCAKAYALKNIGKHSASGFDLCNTTDCQVYYGTGSANATTDRAVDDVSGYCIMYNGRVAETFYHSSSGGYTEDVKNIWTTDLPYLKAVEDMYLVKTLPYSFSITPAELTRRLRDKGYALSADVTDLYVSRYSAVGNVLEVTVVLADGTKLKPFTGDRARTFLNISTDDAARIRSHRYTIGTVTGLFANDTSMDRPIQEYYAIGSGGAVSSVGASSANLKIITGSGVETAQVTNKSFQIKGTGSGHNIGMSQWGAHAMAQRGFTYDQIIQFYFTDVRVERVE